MQGSDLSGDVPSVRLLEDGRVQVHRGRNRVALVWLPKDGSVIAKFPARKGNLHWLHETLRIRSPKFKRDRWELPRNCLGKLVTSAVDRFGYIAVCRDMSKLSRCTTSCLQATGVECDCSCLGAHHGTDAVDWFERVGDVVVADRGEFKRTVILYSCRHDDGEASIYDGELDGRRYTAERRLRLGWPRASEFMCVSCVTERAAVWDHCHTHGYVRAPLCNTCNTRHWKGWQPAYGRAVPSQNLDATYYRRCPLFERPWEGQCSA